MSYKSPSVLEQVSKSSWASSTPSLPVSVPVTRTKSAIRTRTAKRSPLNVHFADMSGSDMHLFKKLLLHGGGSDGECSSLSDGHSDSDLSDCHSLPETCAAQLAEAVAAAAFEEEESEEMSCLKHLDDLGLALENTFKEVESIDHYVLRLREEFQHSVMAEQAFMAHICTARIARTACCKKQLQAWQRLQHELIDYCCHYHHIHHHQDDVSHHSNDSNADIESVIGSLEKLSTFSKVQKRLEPKGDSKSFVDHWIIHGQDSVGHHHYDEDCPQDNSDSDSNLSL